MNFGVSGHDGTPCPPCFQEFTNIIISLWTFSWNIDVVKRFYMNHKKCPVGLRLARKHIFEGKTKAAYPKPSKHQRLILHNDKKDAATTMSSTQAR